jgi:signal transduction histidine kinase/CheY-like chemotaxis protein/HPt (histidine-containing phosphotransfer) domain-containing protein
MAFNFKTIFKNPLGVGLSSLLGLSCFMLFWAGQAYQFQWHSLFYQPAFWGSHAGVLLLAGLAMALITALSVAMQAHHKTQKFAAATQLAEQANTLKTDFLAMISHEMRTPLNGILGMSSLLAETNLDQRQSFYTQSISKSGEHLLALINDLLDVAKIDSGHLELEELDYNLHQLMHDVVDVFSVKANQKSLYLRLDIAPSVPQFVRGDLGRVRQVLFNLLSNAIKFTATGGVQITVKPSPKNNLWQIIVADTGIGIASHQQQVIFEKFRQSDHTTTREFEGTGLGLAICRDLLSMMGGTITVNSVLGQGATFICQLPLQLAHSPVSVNSVAKFKNFGPCRILVAEDSITNQYVVAAMLEKWGCRVTVVANGLEALQAVQQQPIDQMFDLVLMDCHMPEMDGFVASEKIKQLPQVKALPIIALTASAMRGDREKCLAHGMDDYLAKPIDQALLNSALQRWLPNTILGHSLSLNAPNQLTMLKNLMAERFDTLIVQFTAQGEQALAVLNQQPAALSSDIYQQMHRLKAASGQLGFSALSEYSAKVENLETLPNAQQIAEFSQLWQQTLAAIDSFNQTAEQV